MDNRRKKQIYTFAFLTYACIMSVHIMLVLSRWLDNDIYFYLGLGKYMWNNRIVPDYHPFFIGGYLYNMIPQWLYDVSVYLINERAGYTGLYAFMLFWEALGMVFLYKIARLKKVDPIAAILLVIMCFYMSTGVVTIRTNLMTYSLTIIQIFLLEKYKEKSRWFYLIPLLFLSVFEMNAHMALWAMHLCIMVAYICPQIRLPIEINKHTYRLKPLIYTTLIMFEAGMLNPYGLRAYFFIKDGISEDSLQMIEEMQPLDILSGEGLGIILCARGLLHAISKKKTSYEYFYIFAGLVFLGVNQSRNFHWGFLGITILAFDLLKGTDFMACYDRFVPKKMILYFPFILFVAAIIVCHPDMYGLNCNRGYEQVLDEAISKMEEDPDKNVFNDNGVGGYLEWKGYNIYLDTRMDGCMPGFTGGIDILGDYKALSFYASKEQMESIMAKYDFKYALVKKASRLSLYFQMCDGFEKVYEGKAEDTQINTRWEFVLYKRK